MTALHVAIGAVPAAGKFALILLCLTLAGGAGAWALLVPARTRTAALETRRAALEGAIAQARAATAGLTRHRLEGAELHHRLEHIAQKLPTEREIPPLYRHLYEAAFSTGLAVALFQPRDAKIQDYFAEIPITVIAEGTYHQLATFFDRIAGFPRLVTVGSFKMTALERTPVSVRAEMTLATYVYRPPGAPAPPGPTAPGSPGAGQPALATAPSRTTASAPASPSPVTIALDPPAPAVAAYAARGRRDPFGPVPPSPAGNADPATRRHPTIAAARLTGIVRGPDGPLALVEMADGLGHILRAGDGIGEARLVRIGADSVVFAIAPAAGLAGEQIVLGLEPRK